MDDELSARPGYAERGAVPRQKGRRADLPARQAGVAIDARGGRTRWNCVFFNPLMAKSSGESQRKRSTHGRFLPILTREFWRVPPGRPTRASLGGATWPSVKSEAETTRAVAGSSGEARAISRRDVLIAL